jgi:glycosyltransferase involved in cell wall biosynthesis
MKILVGMPSKDSWGGPIASEPPFVAALHEIGVEVREEIYVYGDKVKPTPFFERVKRVLQTAFRFRQVLKSQSFDLIHLNTAFDLRTFLRDTISIFLMKPGNAKIFFKIHGTESRFLESKNPLIIILRNHLKNRADGFGVYTSEEKSDFLRAGFPEEKLFFVKNAITIAENLPENFKRPQKEKTETFNLLFISRFIRGKGLLETIRAWEIVRRAGYKAVLHCVGDGELRQEAEREVERLDLREEVVFTGYIPEQEVEEYFYNSDIFIFPSRFGEGFPMVLFKAVAAGMPIVTTRVRAAKDYLKNEENCLFAAPEPESIAEKIIELIENKDLRKEMSATNLALGKTLLPKNIAQEFLEIYRKIIAG